MKFLFVNDLPGVKRLAGILKITSTNCIFLPKDLESAWTAPLYWTIFRCVYRRFSPPSLLWQFFGSIWKIYCLFKPLIWQLKLSDRFCLWNLFGKDAFENSCIVSENRRSQSLMKQFFALIAVGLNADSKLKSKIGVIFLAILIGLAVRICFHVPLKSGWAVFRAVPLFSS